MFHVISIAIKNKSTRQYLIDTVRIITGLSNFAVKASPYIAEVSVSCFSSLENSELKNCLLSTGQTKSGLEAYRRYYDRYQHFGRRATLDESY